DVLVGKVSPPKFLGSDEEVKMGLASKRETSKTVRHGEGGTVDKVLISETDEGDKLIKTKLREERIPELGDKFATRHGQKGVIGLIVPEEDMPFTEDGVTPDIILSTHAIPSRMTVSQLLEIIGGKAAAMRGDLVDGTAFHSEKEEKLRDTLEEAGF
ncbi:MAG: DNA-directed RNA polymerase subunit B, partial [Candidatus Nanohaloarchaea archaeon]|nr:DNA-directed RNA polymerase subunit B [Candidatus Nanohaloarchaea archaeon]